MDTRAQVLGSDVDLRCSITLKRMKDPVTTSSGTTYERSAITTWFMDHDTDPLTNLIINNKELKPNNGLKYAIESIKKMKEDADILEKKTNTLKKENEELIVKLKEVKYTNVSSSSTARNMGFLHKKRAISDPLPSEHKYAIINYETFSSNHKPCFINYFTDPIVDTHKSIWDEMANNEDKLKIAARDGNINEIDFFLLSRKVNINGRGSASSICSFFRGTRDKTPLMLAVKSGCLETTQYLILKGAKLNLVDVYGYTALDYAIHIERKDIAKLLHDNGAVIQEKKQEHLSRLLEEKAPPRPPKRQGCLG